MSDLSHNVDPSRCGTVFKKSLGAYYVEVQGRTMVCAISSKLRKHLVYPTADPNSVRRRVVDVEDIRTVDPIAVGDVVQFIEAEDGSGMITDVLPRRNKLSRMAAGFKPIEQVIVANVDQIVPVFAAAHPAPKWNLLDRYLATAEAADIPALICITKLDAADRDAIEADADVYRQIGYRVSLTSAVTGEGVEELREALRDRMSVFIGKSGVGKTSLLNAIQPGLGLRVNAVSTATDKGKHTTTHLEMFPLIGGGSVVDTPGMREFNLPDLEDDMALLFPEMRPYIGRCRFGAGCKHRSEPGCAVRKAVDTGQVSERRYHSYLRLREDS